MHPGPSEIAGSFKLSDLSVHSGGVGGELCRGHCSRLRAHAFDTFLGGSCLACLVLVVGRILTHLVYDPPHSVPIDIVHASLGSCKNSLVGRRGAGRAILDMWSGTWLVHCGWCYGFMVHNSLRVI